MEKVITDLFYQPIDESHVMALIAYADGREYSIGEFEYEGHEQDQEGCYNMCWEIAHDLGYVLEGEVE